MNHDEQPQTKSKWTGVLLLLAIKCASHFTSDAKNTEDCGEHTTF